MKFEIKPRVSHFATKRESVEPKKIKERIFNYSWANQKFSWSFKRVVSCHIIRAESEIRLSRRVKDSIHQLKLSAQTHIRNSLLSLRIAAPCINVKGIDVHTRIIHNIFNVEVSKQCFLLCDNMPEVFIMKFFSFLSCKHIITESRDEFYFQRVVASSEIYSIHFQET